MGLENTALKLSGFWILFLNMTVKEIEFNQIQTIFVYLIWNYTALGNCKNGFTLQLIQFSSNVLLNALHTKLKICIFKFRLFDQNQISFLVVFDFLDPAEKNLTMDVFFWPKTQIKKERKKKRKKERKEDQLIMGDWLDCMVRKDLLRAEQFSPEIVETSLNRERS